jgi:hypothetical protein
VESTALHFLILTVAAANDDGEVHRNQRLGGLLSFCETGGGVADRVLAPYAVHTTAGSTSRLQLGSTE